MLLICNNRPAALEIVDAFREGADPVAGLRLLRMHGRGHHDRARLGEDPRRQEALHRLALLEEPEALELALGDPTAPETRT
jgi:beta-N-acetylhexosaminidase